MELEASVLGIIGGAVKWIFAPLGFANIKATIATVMGLVAKEEVVGVFGVLDFEGLTQLSGFAFLIFNLCSYRCYQERDEQRKVDMVRYRLPVRICLRYRTHRISVRPPLHRRRKRNRIDLRSARSCRTCVPPCKTCQESKVKDCIYDRLACRKLGQHLGNSIGCCCSILCGKKSDQRQESRQELMRMPMLPLRTCRQMSQSE